MKNLRNLRDPALYCDPDYVQMYCHSGDNFWSILCTQFVDWAKVSSDDIVADLGCGTGYATREIIKRKPRKVYAIDPSKEMLAGSGSNLNSCTLIHGTIDD